jgi:hypothetical protein
VSAIDGDNGWPLLHDADYVKGHLDILTIPENFSDLSALPEGVLNAIRGVITAHLPVQLEAPGKVSLFVYDNHTFIVENFRDDAVKAQIVVKIGTKSIQDITTAETIPTSDRLTVPTRNRPAVPAASVAAFSLPPHSFRAFRIQ